MRWWKELSNPALKCNRLGHIERREMRSGMRHTTWDERHRGVCIAFKNERTVCRRCGEQLDAPKEISARDIDSWSAPESFWEQFREHGVWYKDDWHAV